MNNSQRYGVGVLATLAAAYAGLATVSFLVSIAVLFGLMAVIITIDTCTEHVCATLSAKQKETNQPVETEKS